MNKIAVVTSTRAEYGLLMPIINKLRKHEGVDFNVHLIVTGTHLSEAYGMTEKEIEADGLRVDYRVRVSVKSDSEQDISSNQAETLKKFTDLFARERYSAVILLGDRYEMLAVAIAAGNTRIPIFHLCGGDTTEGALDEWIRHSITKMSYLHFVSNEKSKKRVIQLGESPERVFNFGSTSIDNVLNIADMPKEEALRSVGLQDCRYAVCTYHPVTMEAGSIETNIHNFLEAIKNFPSIQFIVTKSNADYGGAKINSLLDKAVEEIDNLKVYASLGSRRYLSLMRYCEFVLGNSSSGIIQTPAFHVPTVNIGDRQRGRLQSESIINCNPNVKSIVEAIEKALSKEHKEICKNVISPYGNGHAAEKIAGKIIETISKGDIDLKKKFFDLDF